MIWEYTLKCNDMGGAYHIVSGKINYELRIPNFHEFSNLSDLFGEKTKNK